MTWDFAMIIEPPSCADVSTPDFITLSISMSIYVNQNAAVLMSLSLTQEHQYP